MVAAAIGEIISEEPIVVGGTAEEYWTRDEYHMTDLDLCVGLSRRDEARLAEAGFRKEGRHWSCALVPTVVVEFPASRIDGDETRVRLELIAGIEVKIIGLDDLYLDRLRQATANPFPGSIEYSSTLAVATAQYENLDRGYIGERLHAVTKTEPDTGAEMKRLDRAIQRAARRAIT